MTKNTIEVLDECPNHVGSFQKKDYEYTRAATVTVYNRCKCATVKIHDPVGIFDTVEKTFTCFQTAKSHALMQKAMMKDKGLV